MMNIGVNNRKQGIMDETLVGTPDPDPEEEAFKAEFEKIISAEFGTELEPDSKLVVLTTWADVTDGLDRCADATCNVRRKLDAAGFSAQACDLMASQVWGVLLSNIAGEITRERPKLT